MMTTRTRKNDLNEEKRIRILQLITVAAVVLFVLLLVALITNLVRLAGSNSRKAELEAQLAALDRQIEENNSIIDYRQSEEYAVSYTHLTLPTILLV